MLSLRKMRPWQTQADSGFPGAQPPCHEKNPSHTEPISSGPFHTGGTKKTVLTVGTATTVFPSTLTTATSPPSLPQGGDTSTKQHPRGTSHQVTATQEDLMRSSLISLTRPNAITTHFSGPTISPRGSSKQLSGMTSVATMASS